MVVELTVFVRLSIAAAKTSWSVSMKVWKSGPVSSGASASGGSSVGGASGGSSVGGVSGGSSSEASGSIGSGSSGAIGCGSGGADIA